MGSVLGYSKNMEEEEPSTTEEPKMPAMPSIGQIVPGSSASADPGNDLAYLQEQLLRDKWLKLMSYTQKKKKKKKKDRDKKEKELLPKKVSPKKVSPKKTSPIKISPKKLSPKKVSPKKVSPKKQSPIQQSCNLDQSPSSSTCPLLLLALTSPEKKTAETLAAAQKTITEPLAVARKTTAEPLAVARKTIVEPLAVARKTIAEPLAAAQKTTVKPLAVARKTAAETALSVRKKTPVVKTYSKTEKKLSGWLPTDADYNIFTSGSDTDNSVDKSDAFSTAPTLCPVIPVSPTETTKSFQDSFLKNSLTAVAITATAAKNLKSGFLKSSSTTSKPTTSLKKSPPSTANEYEFSDNDESSILNGPFTKKFSEFKSQKLKSILENGPCLPTNGYLNSDKNDSSKTKTSNSTKEDTLDSREKVVKSLFSEKAPRLYADKRNSCSSIENKKTNGIQSKKPLERKESVSSISSNDSVILKGSSSTSSSSNTSPCSGKKIVNANSDSECSVKDSAPEPVSNERDLVDEMESEADPVCSAKVVAKNNSSAAIEDEILGEGESRGGKTPEVEEEQNVEEKPTVLPVPTNSIKYKSNRYYKPEQSAILWEFYIKNQYPTKAEQAELAKKVGGIEVRRIVWWFTHRRRTDKNKTTLVAPELKAKKTAKVNKPEEVEVQPDLGADVSLACLVTNSCSICSFTDVRPKLMRHLRKKHRLDPAICRRCKKIWQKQFFDEHACKNKKSPKKLKVVDPPDEVQPVLNADASLACLVASTCSVCSFSGVRPKLICHLKKKHHFEPAVCRRCKKIWQKQFFEEHPCSIKKSPRKKTMSGKDIITPEKKVVKDNDNSLHNKSLEKEIKITPEEIPATPVKSECDSSMNISAVNDESVLLETPQKDENFSENDDNDDINDNDDVEMKSETDPTLMPCGSGTKCRTCPYDGPNILRHFQAIHGWQAKKCRKCTHFWEKKHFEEHPCSDKIYDFKSDNVVCLGPKKVAATKKVVEAEASEPEEEAEDEEDQEELAPVFKTPTKRDLQAPTQFYSRRYSDLLSQFSPKKLSKDCPNLSEIMRSSRFHRNGKLDLNYITPKQLEAVQDFMLGDILHRVRL